MEQISSLIRIVSNSTSASETLISPATTSPLSRTRSSTSTRPVERPCPSLSGVGIGSVFYELSRALACVANGDERAYLSNGDATFRRAIWSGNVIHLHRSPTVHLFAPQ